MTILRLVGGFSAIMLSILNVGRTAGHISKTKMKSHRRIGGTGTQVENCRGTYCRKRRMNHDSGENSREARTYHEALAWVYTRYSKGTGRGMGIFEMFHLPICQV